MKQDNKNIEEPQPLNPHEQWELREALSREHVSCPDIDGQWQEVREKLELTDENDTDADGVVPMYTRSWVRWVAGIAATLALIIGYRFWTSPTTSVAHVDATSFAINVPDEIDDVTISTADGKQKQASGKQMKLDQSSSVPAQLMAISTPRGKDYHLTLADGTQVWLNAESHLEFPDRFTGDKREVRLQGEAYFEVKKDAKHPFIVYSDYLTTRVLGTAFNVRARSARDASVTLVTGRVLVKTQDADQVLTPGQQASLAGSQLAVKTVDTYPYTQWKEGFFYFDNQSLFNIMQELARWYGVNVSFDDTSKMHVRLHFVVERNKSLGEAIANLNALGIVHARIEGGVIVID